ncbi:hypothetical protein KQI38_10545 [Tissierella carlieri]|jgi:hypothetical protein|uniref:hypothetical protein n=1 Tax=Tissierella carlieri TaxID=689904 RepID=UPI001C10D91B|nr:hypothetical protein [Tissierella carlieri]MBU5312470.1 hypothetical protein [Tissierella carlieri]
MFKKLNNKKIFSLLLALMLVVGMSVSSFAATLTDDGILVVKAIEGSNQYTAEMKFVDVGGVTRYTGYIEFPNSSSVDLSNVEIVATITGSYTLEVDGTPYTPNMSVDFSEGYVDFVLKSGSTVYRTYQINAGIDGTNVLIFVTIDLENVNDWLDGTYVSPNKEGYIVPKAINNPLAEARAQAAVNGLESGSLLIPFVANIGDSAMTTFSKAIASTNLNVVGISSGYVSEIGRGSADTLPDTLFQRTEGAPNFPPGDYMKDRTGWIYLMNDIVADMGASQYIITASDSTLTWGYTFDWGIDLGGPEW